MIETVPDFQAPDRSERSFCSKAKQTFGEKDLEPRS